MWIKGWGYWLTLILALVFLFFFFRGAKLWEMWQALSHANYLLVLPAIVAYFAGVWVRAWRWRIVLSPLGNFPAHRLFPPIVISFALNNIMPARVGLIARAYLVGKRERISKLSSGSTIVVDQLFDGVALLFLLAVISFWVPLAAWMETIAIVVSVIFGTLLLLLWTLAPFPDWFHRILHRLLRRFPEQAQKRTWEWVESGLWGLRTLRSPGKLLPVFFLSILVWLMEAAMFYFVSRSFNLGLSYHMLLMAVAIANLALILPSLPGGIGPYEYFGKQTLLLFGVREAAATVYLAVVHLSFLLPVTILGLILLWWQRHTLSEVAGGGER